MYEQFVELLVEELQIDRDDITMEAELANDLGINSIELADLVMLCEDKFDIEFDDDDIRKFTTVGDVVAYLESLNIYCVMRDGAYINFETMNLMDYF